MIVTVVVAAAAAAAVGDVASAGDHAVAVVVGNARWISRQGWHKASVARNLLQAL